MTQNSTFLVELEKLSIQYCKVTGNWITTGLTWVPNCNETWLIWPLISLKQYQHLILLSSNQYYLVYCLVFQVCFCANCRMLTADRVVPFKTCLLKSSGTLRFSQISFLQISFYILQLDHIHIFSVKPMW